MRFEYEQFKIRRFSIILRHKSTAQLPNYWCFPPMRPLAKSETPGPAPSTETAAKGPVSCSSQNTGPSRRSIYFSVWLLRAIWFAVFLPQKDYKSNSQRRAFKPCPSLAGHRNHRLLHRPRKDPLMLLHARPRTQAQSSSPASCIAFLSTATPFSSTGAS